MAHFIRRLHHRRSNRKLHPLTILGICLSGAIIAALILGNLLNRWVDDNTSDDLPTEEPNQPSAIGDLPARSTQSVRAYPFALGNSTDRLYPEDGLPPDAVSVSINTPDGKLNYSSAVGNYLRLETTSDAELKSSMQDLTMVIPYVCGVFYPQGIDTDDTDILYAAALSDATILKEFIHAGGSEILLVGVEFDEDALPYLADYLKQLKTLLGNTPIGLSIPSELILEDDGWQLLHSVRPLVDFLALDLQNTADSEMESALLGADYYVTQYEMRLVLSEAQTRWISATEVAFSDYQIVTARSQDSDAQG